MLVLGIDPGISGGLALLSGDGLIHTARMPILKVKGGKSTINIAELGNIITTWAPTVAALERQQVMRKAGVRPGAVSSFTTGLNYGVLLGFFYGRKISVHEIIPKTWKKALGLSSDKDESRHRAMQMWPDNANDFRLACQDGVAEAALIAYYYYRAMRSHQTT